MCQVSIYNIITHINTLSAFIISIISIIVLLLIIVEVSFFTIQSIKSFLFAKEILLCIWTIGFAVDYEDYPDFWFRNSLYHTVMGYLRSKTRLMVNKNSSIRKPFNVYNIIIFIINIYTAIFVLMTSLVFLQYYSSYNFESEKCNVFKEFFSGKNKIYYEFDVEKDMYE